MSAKQSVLRGAQRLLFATGVLCIGLYLGRSFHNVIVSHVAAARFTEVRTPPSQKQSMGLPPKHSQQLDFTLWSEKRIVAYEESLLRHFGPPIALIRIRRLGLEAPVLEGTDDLTLDRGVGHIQGTALPGQTGNMAVAGHRDGFFRVLKDIAPGDTIEVLTATKKYTYAVDQIVLVLPKDISVLEPGSTESLTLVTCYPFYFIGSAPKRYIVKALLTKFEVIQEADESGNEIAISTQ